MLALLTYFLFLALFVIVARGSDLFLVVKRLGLINLLSLEVKSGFCSAVLFVDLNERVDVAEFAEDGEILLEDGAEFSDGGEILLEDLVGSLEEGGVFLDFKAEDDVGDIRLLFVVVLEALDAIGDLLRNDEDIVS